MSENLAKSASVSAVFIRRNSLGIDNSGSPASFRSSFRCAISANRLAIAVDGDVDGKSDAGARTCAGVSDTSLGFANGAMLAADIAAVDANNVRRFSSERFGNSSAILPSMALKGWRLIAMFAISATSSLENHLAAILAGW